MGRFRDLTGERFGRLLVQRKDGYNKVLEHQGRKQTMQQWCDELSLKISTVWARINKYGYSVEIALTPGWRAKNA